MAKDYSSMYKNKFTNLYDLWQDIIEYKEKNNNEEIIYWSTFWKGGAHWYKSWKNGACNKSWIFDPEGYDDEEKGGWLYDFEKFGESNFKIIVGAMSKRDFELLTAIFNNKKLLDLKAFW